MGERAAQTAFASTVMGAFEGQGGAAASSPPVAGAGRYEHGVLLGEGGMGRVVEATDRQFGRSVALKEMRAEAAGALRDRFLIEALVTANLEHPGIAPVYERGVDQGGRPFYTMRLVRGRTLSTALGAASTLDERLRLVPVVLRTAQTVAYAHERGVVHRDIKPDNVIVGRHGETVLLDWGIAKVRDAPGADALDRLADVGVSVAATQLGAVVGTPAYMAPEQARGDTARIDERTDVFALGALLYHVLSGRPPYGGPTVDSQVEQAIASSARPVAELEPGAPPALVAICQRAMASDPAARYGSAAELAEALEAAMAGALGRQESRLINAFATAVSVGGLALCVLGLPLAWRVIPTVHEMGWGSYPTLSIGSVALVIGVIELLTKGRYTLSSLQLALCGMTLLSGAMGTLTGLLNTLRFAQRPDIAVDPKEAHDALLTGATESLGLVIVGVAASTLLLLLWGVGRRVTLRNEAARRRS